MQKETGNKPILVLLAGIMMTSTMLSHSQIMVKANNEIKIKATLNEFNERLQVTSIVPGFSKVTLNYTPIHEGDEYDIYRSNSLDGNFVKVGSSSTGKFVDEVGANVIRYYQIKSKDSSIISNVMGNVKKTGVQAMKDRAPLYQNVKDTKFDGNTMIDVSASASVIRKLNAGSIVFRFKTTVNNQNLAVLMGKTKGETVNITGAGNKASTLLTNGSVREDFVHTRATALIGLADGEWHTVAIMNDTTSKGAFRFTIDGKELGYFDAGNNNSNVGFFSTVKNLNELTIGGYRNGDNTNILNGFQGELDYVMVSDEVLSTQDAKMFTNEENGIVCDLSSQMFNSSPDNTWVFSGGRDIAGGYEDTKGIRNFTGQFEEYVRWTVSGNSTAGKQRYVINTARKGNSLAYVDQKFDELVRRYDPKALTIMPSLEDMIDGIEGLTDFKENLKGIMEQALSLRNEQGYLVIQTPYVRNNEERNTIVNAYADACKEFYNELDVNQKRRVMLVDHYTLTKTEAFKKKALNEDGQINEYGHLEIAKQLTKAVFGSIDAFPVNEGSFQYKKIKTPDTYVEVFPEVTIQGCSMNVALPTSALDITNEWTYTLQFDDQKISGRFQNGEAVLQQLPLNKDYTLHVTSLDKRVQLATLQGNIQEGNTAQLKPTQPTAFTRQQEQIQDLLKSKSQINWLFVGDSITHGALHTLGYDSIHQTFEKYVHEDMGRLDDVVVNTAVSGATTANQESNSNERLDKYDADVVMVMLGTNDAPGAVSISQYQVNLEKLVTKIRDKGAIPVLRTPNPLRTNDPRALNLVKYAQVIRNVAEEMDVLLVDHNADWSKELETRTYLWENGYWNNDAIHPNANGQLNMSQALIRDLGLADENSTLYHLAYEMPHTTENSKLKPSLHVEDQTISVDIAKLTAAYGNAFGNIRLYAEREGMTYSTQGSITDTSIMLENLIGDQTYDVRVEADLLNTNKTITFQNETIYIQPAFEVTLDFEAVNLQSLQPGTLVGVLQVLDDVPQTPIYSFVGGEGSEHNDQFMLENDQLKIKKTLDNGKTY